MSTPWDPADDPDELGLAGGLGPHFPGDVRLPGEAGDFEDEELVDPSGADADWASGDFDPDRADGPGLPAPGRHGGLRPVDGAEPGDDPLDDVRTGLDGLSTRLAAARALVADRATPGQEGSGPVGAVPEPGGTEGGDGGPDGGHGSPSGVGERPVGPRKRVAKRARRPKSTPERDDGDGGSGPLELGPEPVAERTMGRPGYPVDDLVRFLANRPAPTEEPAATGFREATFSAIFKSAGLRSTGAWRVILEVPSAEAEAFFPVRKAFELELTCTVRRKTTETPGQEGTSEEAAGQEGGRSKAGSRKGTGRRRRAGAA